ncbi:MAG: hypothetical protein WDW38_002355 [Sanguina aurantia]
MRDSVNRVMLLLAALAVASQVTAKQSISAWTPEQYPNPQFNASLCGRPGVEMSWLCDPDGVLSADSRNVVEGVIQQIAVGDAPFSRAPCGSLGDVGSQVGVALMKEFQVPLGSNPSRVAELFARGLHDDWRVGHALCQDGVLLLLSKDNRQMYISTGTGVMGRLSSSVVDAIIVNARPLLRTNRFDAAVEGAVLDIGLALAGRLSPHEADGDDGEGAGSILPLAVFIGIFSLAGSASFYRERKQRRRFSDCKSKLEKLKKDQAAARLDPSFNATSCPICLEDFTPGVPNKQVQDGASVPSLDDDNEHGHASELHTLLPTQGPSPETGSTSSGTATPTPPAYNPRARSPPSQVAGRKRPWYNPWAKLPAHATPDLSGARMPLILPCRHAFCEPCISTWVDGGKVSCPVCRVHLDGSSAVPGVPDPDRLPGQPPRQQQQQQQQQDDGSDGPGSQTQGGRPGGCSAGMHGAGSVPGETLAQRQRRQAWYDQMLMAEMMFRMRSLHTQYPDFVPSSMVDSMSQDVQQGRELGTEALRTFQLNDPALRAQNMASGSHGMSSGFGGGSSGGGGGRQLLKMSIDDWMQHVDLLPARPETFVEAKYLRYFAVDVCGHAGHDQYVYIAQNGLAVVGLAPSHPLIREHRSLSSYTPLTQTTAVDAALLSLVQTPGPSQSEDDGPAQTADGGGGGSSEPKAQPKNLNKKAKLAPAAQEGAPATDPGTPGPAKSFPLEEVQGVSYVVGKKDRSSIKTSGKHAAGSFLQPSSVLCTISSRAKPPSSVTLWACIAGKLLEVNPRLLTDPSLLFNRPCCEGYVAILMPSPGELSSAKSSLLDEVAYMKLRGLTAEELL